jgi:hypothetical protein
MHKLLLFLALIATAAISIGRPVAAEPWFAGSLSSLIATDTTGSDAAFVLVGGGMGGGATTGGGMRGGTIGGGMGGGATTGGMGGGTTGDLPGNSAQPSYYTYQCTTPAGGCSFVAPASLRSSSLRAGARCSCSDGLSEGQVR